MQGSDILSMAMNKYQDGNSAVEKWASEDQPTIGFL